MNDGASGERASSRETRTGSPFAHTNVFAVYEWIADDACSPLGPSQPIGRQDEQRLAADAARKGVRRRDDLDRKGVAADLDRA